MSDDLAMLAAMSMGPGSVDDLLRETMARLLNEYPSAKLHSVTVSFSYTVRGEGPSPEERELSWRVQASNERGYGVSVAAALNELHKRWEASVMVPDVAERIAAALRDVPSEGFCQDRALSLAREILELERLNRR
jgi:hypothetical protein